MKLPKWKWRLSWKGQIFKPRAVVCLQYLKTKGLKTKRARWWKNLHTFACIFKWALFIKTSSRTVLAYDLSGWIDNTLTDSKFLWLYKGLALIAGLEKTLTSPTQILCSVCSKLYPNSSLIIVHWGIAINACGSTQENSSPDAVREIFYSQGDIQPPNHHSESRIKVIMLELSLWCALFFSLSLRLMVECCSFFLKDSPMTGQVWGMHTITVILQVTFKLEFLLRYQEKGENYNNNNNLLQFPPLSCGAFLLLVE